MSDRFLSEVLGISKVTARTSPSLSKAWSTLSVITVNTLFVELEKLKPYFSSERKSCEVRWLNNSTMINLYYFVKMRLTVRRTRVAKEWNYKRGFLLNRNVRSSNFLIVALRESISQFRSIFHKHYCRNAINTTWFIWIQLIDDSRNDWWSFMHKIYFNIIWVLFHNLLRY